MRAERVCRSMDGTEVDRCQYLHVCRMLDLREDSRYHDSPRCLLNGSLTEPRDWKYG